MQKKVHLKTKHLVQPLKILQYQLFVVVLLIIPLDNIFLFLLNLLALLHLFLVPPFFEFLVFKPQLEMKHFPKLFGEAKVRSVETPYPSCAVLYLLTLFQKLLTNHFPQKILGHELVQLILTYI